jgi:hypothetical protein
MHEAALAALEAPGDPWDALAGFLRWYLESGMPRLAGLLGAFVPEEDLFELAHETNQAMQALVKRTAKAGRLRDDITGADLTLIVTLDLPQWHGRSPVAVDHEAVEVVTQSRVEGGDLGAGRVGQGAQPAVQRVPSKRLGPRRSRPAPCAPHDAAL